MEREGANPANQDRTFKGLAGRYFANKGGADATKEKEGKFLEVFEEFLQRKNCAKDIKDITDLVIGGFIADRKEKKCSAALVNFYISCLKWVFKKFCGAGLIVGNPTGDIKYEQEVRMAKVLPTKEEVEQILRWFLKHELLFYPWVYFLATRGWRRNELGLMKIEDVDLPNEKLYVKNTKTRVQRTERLSQQDCLILSEHFISLKKKKLYKLSGYLFPSSKGELLCKNTLLKKVKQAAKAVGITKNITNHLFRHYVVTSILDQTANIEVIKAITGHKDTKTILEHYAHATPENVKRGLEITHINMGLKLIFRS